MGAAIALYMFPILSCSRVILLVYLRREDRMVGSDRLSNRLLNIYLPPCFISSSCCFLSTGWPSSPSAEILLKFY